MPARSPMHLAWIASSSTGSPGVLSAYGMGWLNSACSRSALSKNFWPQSGVEEAERVLADLERQARAELLAQGSEIEEMVRKFNIRYEGTNTPLSVEAGTVEEMEKGVPQGSSNAVRLCDGFRRPSIGYRLGFAGGDRPERHAV